jgi:hypothetical protein
MSTLTFTFPYRLRPAHLTACLAAALGLTLSIAHASDAPMTQMPSAHGRLTSAVDVLPYLRGNVASPNATRMDVPTKPAALPHYVTTCGDDAATPGTLRYEVAHASSGDTIDLSTLVCSTITLGSEIVVPQDSLYVDGSPSASVTIDGDSHSRVFKHTGLGTLTITDLTIANGYYTSNGAAKGGCIDSAANVALNQSIISNCTLKATGSSQAESAHGAGIYAHGNLSLFASTISGSDAYANGCGASGGGAYVHGDFYAKYSTISDNTAYDNADAFRSTGGGVLALSDVSIQGSTISKNRAEYVGALIFLGNLSRTVSISNSTISTNTGLRSSGGIWTNAPLTLANSTVVFNTSRYYNMGIGLFSDGATITIDSSILAGSVGEAGAADFYLSGAAPNISSSIITSGSLYPGAVQDCPQLEPLADNGGVTLTHALRHTSPAIDQGHTTGNLTTDQRLAPRTAGAQADIGSVEWQPGETDDRILVNGFDGLCDR